MSTFWEEYKKRVAEGADRLSAPPKEVEQNILWLKAYVTERMDKEGLVKFVGTSGTDTFGFKEETVNLLMHYAYEAGKNERVDSYKRDTADMRAALDKVKDALEDIGWIEYGDN